MPRQPSLRSQLNQIRAWVRQGRTNAWIAHQLDITIDQLERFKREHELEGTAQSTQRPADPLSVPPPEPADRQDAGEEEEEKEEEEQEEQGAERAEAASSPRRGSRGGRGRTRPKERAEHDRTSQQAQRDERAPGDPPAKGRRRGRRGGRRRSSVPSYEATFDHGEEGYGLWLDPPVVDNPIYSEHWAGQRAVVVRIDADSITIRRAEAGRGRDQ